MANLKSTISKVTLSPGYELTVEHAASSYNRPVLVRRSTGEGFGPEDILVAFPSWSYMSAWQIVQRLAATRAFTNAELEFVRKFTKGGAE